MRTRLLDRPGCLVSSRVFVVQASTPVQSAGTRSPVSGEAQPRLHRSAGPSARFMVLSFLLILPVLAAGQSGTPRLQPGSPAYTPPRTPWGDPDLQGVWPGTAMMGVPQQRPTQFGNRASATDEEFAARLAQAKRQEDAANEELVAPRPAGGPAGNTGGPGHWGERGLPQRQTSLVVDPPDGRIPEMTPEGKRRTAAIPASLYYDNDGGGVFNGAEDLSVYDRCITRGVVGSMMPVGYNAGNEIVQGPGFVALRNEMIHEVRIFAMDGRPHLSPKIRTYMGDSRARWEGASLVVDTTNFNGKTGVGANGRAIYHSDALHLIERFTRTGPETLEYEVVIDDPKTWVRPWTMRFPLTRQPGYGMFEYACHEGNYGLQNILSAARAADEDTKRAVKGGQR
jgi:hypothetical protein